MNANREQLEFIKNLYNKNNNEDYCLNFRIYSFKSSKFKALSEEQKEYLFSMKDQIINNLPFLGNFCASKLTLNSCFEIDNIVHYTFTLETSSIKHKDGYPVKIISNNTVMCKHYLNRDVIAIISKVFTDYNFLLSIIHIFPDFIKLKTNLGLDFQYTIPKFNELFLEKSVLQFFKSIFDDSLVVCNFSIDDLQFDVLQLSALFHENDVIILKPVTSSKKLINSIDFYYKDKTEIRRKFIINNKACIFSDICITEEFFYSLVDIIYLLNKNSYYMNFLKPFKLSIDEYCSYIHKDMYQTARNMHMQLICKEFKDILISHFKLNIHILTDIYFSVLFNVLIELYNKISETSLSLNFEISEYPSLQNFIKIFVKNKYHSQLDDNSIIRMFSKLNNILKQCKTEEDIINFYKNTYSN